VNIAVPTGFLLGSGLGGGEVRGLTSLAEPAGAAGTTAVDAKERLSQALQKPPRRKWFPGVCLAALEVAGKVQEDLLGCWQTTMADSGLLGRHADAKRLATASRAAQFGVCVPKGLEPADGDDLIPGPDRDGEGVGPMAPNSVGDVIGVL
jgi:hypothetical protein